MMDYAWKMMDSNDDQYMTNPCVSDDQKCPLIQEKWGITREKWWVLGIWQKNDKFGRGRWQKYGGYGEL